MTQQAPERPDLSPRMADALESGGRIGLAAVALAFFILLTVEFGLPAAVTTTVVLVVGYRVLSRPVDGMTAVGTLVVVLLLWPSAMRVSGLGAAGAPIVIFGVLAFGLWAFERVKGSRWTLGLPARLLAAVGLLSASLILSYVRANLRPDLDLLELSAADRGLMTVLASVGVLLFVASVVRTEDRLRSAIRYIVLAGSVAALLGVVEFFTGFNPVPLVQLPGLDEQASNWDNGRSGFTRVFATAAHPIEYSVVMAMVLPLALHLAFRAEGRRQWWLWWTCVALLGAVLPMTVSRTAVLALAAVGLVLFPGWSWRRRINMLFAALVGVVGMRAVVPGLIGTIRSLFTSADTDPSVSARTSDYEDAYSYLVDNPFFGRGFGTFVPSRYGFLDNEFLMTAVTGGIIGLIALLVLFLVPLGMGATLVHRALTDERRDLARSLSAGLLAAFVTAATYDSMSFSTARGLTYLYIGLLGALWCVDGLGDRLALRRRELARVGAGAHRA